MATYNAGSAAVDIFPDFSGFMTKISQESDRAGTAGGQIFGRSFVESANRAAGGINLGPSPAETSRQGDSAGGAFADAFRKRVQAALQALPDAKVGADTSEADRKLAEIRAQLDELSGKNIGVDLTDAEAVAKLDELKASLDELGARSPNVRVQVDTARASAELAAFRGEVDALGSSGGGGGFFSGLWSSFLSGAEQARSETSGMLAGVMAFGSALIPLGAVALASLGGIASVFTTVAAAAGVAALALGPVLSVVKAIDTAQQTAGASATKSATQQASAANQVRSAQAGLAEAEANAADSRARSAEQVANAQRSLASAVQQAAANQVADAEQIANAELALRDAQAQQANDQIDQQERLQAAAQGVTQAEVEAGRQMQQAEDQVTSAERRLADAQYSEQQAQENLTKARQDASRQLEDYQTQLQDGALQQQQAALDVAQAQDQLNQTLANPKATDLQRQQAQLSYEEALQRQKDLAAQYQRLQQDASAAAAAGVDGSDRVQQALHGEQQATQGVTDAQGALGAAQGAVILAQIDGASKVAAAQQTLGDTERSIAQQQTSDAERIQAVQQTLGDTERSIAQQRQADQDRIRAAQQSAADAQVAAATQERQSAYSVAQAQQQVQNALTSQATAGQSASSAADKATEAFAKLSPAGQAFVTFITGTLEPALHGLEGAAETGFLPGLQAAITNALPLLPPLTSFITILGGAMGRLAQAAATAFQSPFWQTFFLWVSGQAGPILSTFGGILGNLAQGFAGMVEALQPVTTIIGAGLLHLSQAFADWTNPNGQAEGFTGFVGYVIRALPIVVSTVESVVRAIGHILVAAAPIGVVILPIFKGFADLISAIPTPVLTALVGVLAAVGAFLLPLPVLIGVLVSALVILAENWSAVWGGIKSVFDTVWNDGIKPALDAVVTFFTQTLPGAFGTVISWLEDNWPLVLEIITGPIGLAVGQIVQHWSDITGAFSTAWGWVSGAFDSAWSTVETIIFTPVHLAKVALDTTWGALEGAFSAAWDWVSGIFSAVWSGVETIVIGPISSAVSAITDVGKGLWHLIRQAFSDAWDWVSGTWSTVWGTVTGVITGPLSAVSSLVSGIWADIKGAFVTGVNDVIRIINTFINAIDAVVGAVPGLPNHLIPDIPLIPVASAPPNPTGIKSPHLAAGGVIPGYAPGQDSVLAMVSPGEAVLRPEVTRWLGESTIHTWNAAAKGGQLPRFDLGGIVGDILGIPGDVLGGVVHFGEGLLKDVSGVVLAPLKAAADAALGLLPDSFIKRLAEGVVNVVFGGLGGDSSAPSGDAKTPSGARSLAHSLLGQFGWGDDQFPPLVALWNQESGWRWDAKNPSSGAYGIPQSLPGSKMASAGSDWLTNPATQILWGLGYIRDRYKTPAGAEAHELALHWYDEGGLLPPGLSMVMNGTGKYEPVLTPDQLASIAGGDDVLSELREIRSLLRTNPADTGDHVAAGVSGEFQRAAVAHADRTTMNVRTGAGRGR